MERLALMMRPERPGEAPTAPLRNPWKWARLGHGQGLDQALERWRGRASVAGAALYDSTESPPRLLGRCGAGTFPAELPPNFPYAVLELPLGILALGSASGSPPTAEDPATALLVAEIRIYQLEEQLRHHHFQANYRGVEMEALHEVGLAIVGTFDLARLSEEILLRAVSLLDARRGAFYACEEGRYQLRSTLGGEAWGASGSLEDWRSRLDEQHQPGGSSALADLLPGCRFVLAAAIESEGQRGGLIVVGDKESRVGVGPFSTQDRRTLEHFVQQAAIALENAHLHRQALEKERLERDMELAAEIQQQLLPKEMPELEGYEVTGWNRPARQVGGDYFDLLNLDEKRFSLVVADVSGKGMPAALMVSTLHSALRLSLDRFGTGPELLSRLNRHLLELSLPNKFITLFLAELCPETGRMIYVNAGHNPGLLVRDDGTVELLEAGGLPLGLLPQSQYRAAEVDLAPGELLCLYSDGITECSSAREEEFGTQRLADFLVERRRQPLADLAEAIEEACRTFAEGQPQGDDQTLVLLRRLAEPTSPEPA